MAEKLIVSDVARMLGVTTDRVRQIERSGQLPAQRTPGGVRIFDRSDVERLIAQRRQEGLRHAEQQ